MRFLHQFGFGAGDYTQERRAFLPDLTIEEWLTAGRRAEKAAVQRVAKQPRGERRPLGRDSARTAWSNMQGPLA
ncbi:hypothetical protein RAS1_31270 [Phycisphaerae bacterium RAS1]|nr:hypothetical protein RAS1_31270 [Phycisphaerae bacterium RAS1]